MRKLFSFCLLGMLFLVSSSAQCDTQPSRSLFITVLQDPPVLSSREEITKLIDFAKKARIQLLFVQIYRANKAWFPSKVGDSSPYETALKNVSEDPFALLIEEARAAGIEVHAWLNLLSLSGNGNAKLLKKYGPEILTKSPKEKQTIEDHKTDNQYFLEAGDLRLQEEFSNLVEEIVRAYPGLDGIQFDYIRYPDWKPPYGYTQANIERFKEATGLETIREENKAWKNWKRAQVTGLLELLIHKARAVRPDIQVSATGLMPFSRAFHEGFQDWQLWLDNGLVDFVTLMCYAKKTEDFEKYLADAKNKAGDLKKVNIAVGPYALLKSPEIFGEQFELCEQFGARGCAILHYGSLVESEDLANFVVKK